jgi:hypothetical protein
MTWGGFMRSLMIGLLAGAVSVSMSAAAFAADAKIHIVAPPSGLGLSLPVPDKNWTPERNADGHVSLENSWTNATITPLERPATPGFGKVLTQAQKDQLEGKTAAEIARGNAKTKVDASVEEVSKSGDCSGGRGNNCNYNAAWTDPGSVVIKVNGEPRSSFIVSTDNGRIPPRVGGQANAVSTISEEDSEEGGARRRPAARRFPAGMKQNDNPEGRSLGERCIMSFGQSSGPIMSPQLYNNTYQFVQGKDAVAIQVEMVHEVRVVRLGDKHRVDGIRPWMGDSIGHWEGDTLVVETTGFNAQQASRGGDENLKVTERFTRLGKGRLLYQFIIEDPTYWGKPWAGEYEFVTATGPIYEYACHEGNYGLQNILAGAREEEREAAAAAAAKPRADAAPTAQPTTTAAR